LVALCSIAASVALLSPLPTSSAAAAARAKPNVVLIFADDLGYGEIGAYGAREIPTPNIDALGRSGAMFTAGYVSAPQCAPSRAALMTGRYQQRFGFYYNQPLPTDPAYRRFGLPLSEVTLASELARLGYATGVIGKWHLGFKPEHFPLRRGFSEFYGFLFGPSTYFGAGPGAGLYRNGQPATESQYLTRAFARESAAFIRRHGARPFFLFAAMTATHLPMQAEPQMLARFAHIADPKRRTFAAMLTHLDEAVGEIVAEIAAQGLTNDTLVVFATDNGCITFKSTCRNRPLRGGKGLLYEGGIRVPFILSWPGTIPAQRRLDQPVTTRDLFPTFLAAATGTAYGNPRLDGTNLLPLARGATRTAPHDTLFWRGSGGNAVRRGNWKMLDWNGLPTQLFDLSRDPGESVDLAAQHPTILNELRAARTAWGRGLIPPLWPPGV
jgi:arylsulfatase A-like enzyme